MKRGIVSWGSLVGTAMIAMGCGGGGAKGAAAPPSPTSTAAPTTTSAGPGAVANAGTAPSPSAAPPGPPPPAAVPPAPPKERPFANNAEEASSLIDDAINSRAAELGQCVEDARARRKSPHERLVVEVGIDEEGHLLGIQLPKKEKADKAFVDCVLAGLRGAPFPRSHAGVITLRRTFEDKAVYR